MPNVECPQVDPEPNLLAGENHRPRASCSGHSLRRPLRLRHEVGEALSSNRLFAELGKGAAAIVR